MLDRLEARYLLSTLAIDGSHSVDRIDITLVGGAIRVTNNGTHNITGNSLSIAIGASRDFSSVTAISVNAGDAGDRVTATDAVTVPITILGGTGNDTLTGGRRRDSISGGDGNDSISGGRDNDSIDGGTGNDTITGDSGSTTGSDTIFGGLGNDSLSGGLGGDVIYGDDNNVNLADDGNDTIDGGDATDAVIGNGGLDSIGGGAGDDFIFNLDGKTDTLDGGSGTTDRCEPIVTDPDVFSSSGGGIEQQSSTLGVQVIGNGVQIVVNGTEKDDQLTVTDDGQNITLDINGLEITMPLDLLQELANLIAPGQILSGLSVFGGGGNDTISALGNFTFPIVLDGGAGNDFLQGGLGDELIQGGDGIDTVDYSAQQVALSLTLDGKQNDGPRELKGVKFDNIRPDVENIVGGHGADFIQGSNLANSLWGGAGNDSIEGLGGNDVVFAGAGDDVVHGGAGNDILRGESGLDLLDGGDGNDRLINVLKEKDSLIGGAGIDIADKVIGAGSLIDKVEKTITRQF